jgi:protein-S-isoprenylcysteine O-methyltransferase Ste14
MVLQPLLLAHLTAFRSLLFLCCVGYWWLLYAWVRPTPQAVRRGTLAALVQFWLGLVVDIGYVKAQVWVYRPMPFSVAGVPIDLHLDWSLLWGFGLVWLADRILGKSPRTGAVALYIAAWTVVTLAFDIAIAHWMLFLDTTHPLWWLADTVFLLVVQGFTLWFYRSIGTADEPVCGLGVLPPVRPYLRALIYLSFALPCFFLFLPQQIEAAAIMLGWNIVSTPIPGVSWVCLCMALALGGWATHEFARRGRGTPLPWDPPRYLVDSGPYAVTANPMQQAGLLLTVAVLASRPSWVMGGYLLDVVVIVALVFEMVEPPTLRQRFSQAYDTYRVTVRPWRYTLTPYRRDKDQRPDLF